MAKKTPEINEFRPSRFLKVTLPPLQLEDCPDGHLLAGDYLLELRQFLDHRYDWIVRFKAVCGYMAIRAKAVQQEDGTWELIVQALGGIERIEWKLSGIKQVTPGELQVLSQEYNSDEWPDELEVLPLVNEKGAATEQFFAMFRGSVKSGSPGTMSLLMAGNCQPCCWLFDNEHVYAQLVGMAGCYGNACSGYNRRYTLDYLGPASCTWKTGVTPPSCEPDPNAFMDFTISEHDCCEGLLRLDVYLNSHSDFHYSAIVDITTISSSRITLTLENYDADECEPDASSIGVWGLTFTRNDKEQPERNKYGCCPNSPVVPVLVDAGGPEERLELCCCKCGCSGPELSSPASQVAGTSLDSGSSCSSGSCFASIDITTGGLGIILSPPGFGSCESMTGISWNSSPDETLEDSPTGYGTTSTFVETIVPVSDICDIVKKCDGSEFFYSCMHPVSGDYKSCGKNINTLVKHLSGGHAGEWTEKQGVNGDEYDFDTDRILYRIRQSRDARTHIWTIVSSSPVSKVIDPFGRRTTYTYNGSSKLRRITDPYNRITTYSVDGSGNLVSQTTPGLCTTELRYDASHRVTAIIAPDSCRTTYAYDLIGRVKRVQYPGRGIYSFVYRSATSTRTVDPTGAMTTLTLDADQNITSMINPLGQETRYRYTNGRLDVQIQPSGMRTSFTYVRLPTGGIAQESQITPAGTTSWRYNTDGQVTAEINALGRRTTFTYNANGQRNAVINALNARTTYLYNTNGLLGATINPLGFRTTNVYDTIGQVSAVINPLGHRTSYVYKNGKRTAIVNPLNQRTTTLYDLSNRVITTIDGMGNRTSMTYNTGCRVLATIQPNGARTTNVYACDQLKASINPLNNRTSFVYDTRGNRVRSQTPLSRYTTTVYDTLNRPIATIAPTGFRSTVTFDADGRMRAHIAPTGLRTTNTYGTVYQGPLVTIEPIGTRTTYTYNALNNTIQTKFATGGITTTTYDTLQRVSATIDPLGKRTTTVYDASNQAVAIIDALGFRTTIVYNAVGLSASTISPLGNRTTNVYDIVDRTIASINPKNNRWTTVYDTANRPIASIDPLNRRTTSVYDSNSRLKATINASGNRTTNVFDTASQPIGRIDAKSCRTTNVYNSDGQISVSINALGYRTTMVYDSGGRFKAIRNARDYRTTTIYNSVGQTVAMQNALNNRWTSAYNSVGQAVSTRDPLGNRTTIVYDPAGRTVASINPLGKRTTTVYNVAMQAIAQIDANNHRVSSVYDAVGRRIAEINALGYRTTTVFDGIGQTKARIDSRNNRYSFSYDSSGAQTQQIDPLNRRSTFVYDAAQQQALRVDARGYRTTFGYDNVGQLSQRKYPDGTCCTFTFDSVGNRTLMHDATGRYTFAYDGVGQTLVANDGLSKEISYTYDSVGNRRSMDVPDSGRFTYTHNALNQMSTILNPFLERTTYSYDSAGRRIVERLSNGTRASLVYDNASNLTELHNRTSTGVNISTFGYQYDNVNNRKGLLEANGDRVTWVYDNTDQLLAERRSGVSSYANTFLYDSAGNRTAHIADSVRTTYVYDNASQLTYVQVNASRTTYIFDRSGNQILEYTPAGARTSVVWDYENQPIVYKLPDSTRITLSYNSDSRRIKKQSANEIINFTWDVPFDSYLIELDGTNTLQAVYTNGPAHFGRLVSQRRGSSSSWFHLDALGSIRAITNTGQSATDTYLYAAWGNLVTTSGSSVNPFKWVGSIGYYHDSEFGIYYIRARSYQPINGRWTSVDPLDTGIPASATLTRHYRSQNSYLAFSNSPVVATDPQGLWVPSPPFGLPDYLPPGGSFFLDWPPSDAKCALVTTLLDRYAIGLNQQLLDHWKEGSEASLTLSMDSFDSTGSYRRRAIYAAKSAGQELVRQMECGETRYFEHIQAEPTSSNAINTLITPMIFKFRFWYECKGSVTKTCRWICKLSGTIKGTCHYHAHDFVDFVYPKSFLVPPYLVSDRLVVACFPKGKGFNVSANDVRTFDGTFSLCRPELVK